MRIGISIFTHPGQSVWENGVGKSVFYLASLLQSLPMVKGIVLLNCGDQDNLSEEIIRSGFDFPLVRPREATDLIDVVIELGGELNPEWLDYIRAVGKKVIFFYCGQPYASLVEPTLFACRRFFSRPDRCDAVWILPRDLSFAPMLRSMHRCPVVSVPYLWSPEFLDRRAAELADLGISFGYQGAATAAHSAGQHSLRIAIMASNISITKTCSIPMLVCEAAYRIDSNSVSQMHVLNSIQMRRHPTFACLVSSFELYKDNKVVLEQRHDFAGYMSQFGDAVVAHQWQHDQNSLYLDALHGGYPLVHNSPWLKSVGYYYDGFSISGGAGQLIRASKEHKSHIKEYRRAANDFIKNLSPFAIANCKKYAYRLFELINGCVLDGGY